MKRLLSLVLLITLVCAPGEVGAGAYSAYKSLTRAEKWLAFRYFWQLPGVYGASNFARGIATSTYPSLAGQHDQRDAFRHSCWNGSMVRRLKSVKAAERWGNAHEAKPNNPPQAKAMDLNNNRHGRGLIWSKRKRSGPWWRRRNSFPSDGAIAGIMKSEIESGGLRMVEDVGGRRDAQAGRLVPTTKP